MKKFIIFSVVALLIGFAARAMWSRISDTHLGSRLIGQVARDVVGSNQSMVTLLDTLLGFDEPRTYLILFLNNTELRPGGGFIGAYGIGTIANGHFDLITVEGTEIFDGQGKTDTLPDPPGPIKNKLKVKKWFFRDSNWSPDFRLSAAQALDFYKREGGYLADEVDGVIGFTPTVVERFLRLNGPVSVDGFTFNEQNVTEQLQYQVEYGFAERGIPRSERKSLLRDFSIAVLKTAKQNGLWHAREYLALANDMVSQKQIMFYSPHQDTQKIVEQLGYAGAQSPATSDYVQWVDANLGALKTDWAMERELVYAFAPSSTGYAGSVRVNYKHTKPRDWRTSRYISYTRVYLPEGTQVLGAWLTAGGKSTQMPIDQGGENGRLWAGTYITIEPQTEATLTFDVILAPQVTKAIQQGNYSLAVDKELGVNRARLTLDLAFDKNIASAIPAQNADERVTKTFQSTTDLSVNRLFTIALER